MTPKQFRKWLGKYYPDARVEEYTFLNLGRKYKRVRVTLYQQGLWAVILERSTLGIDIWVKNPSSGRTWVTIRPEEAAAFSKALEQAVVIAANVTTDWHRLVRAYEEEKNEKQAA